jgi:hypothetical protein
MIPSDEQLEVMLGEIERFLRRDRPPLLTQAAVFDQDAPTTITDIRPACTVCGHMFDAHDHHRLGADCGTIDCGCRKYRPPTLRARLRRWLQA